MSVDPDVAETGQPYAFTGDDPLNETDPLGSIVNQRPGEPMAGVSAKSAVKADTIDYNDFTNAEIDDEAAYNKKADSGPISPWIAYPALGLGLLVPGFDNGPDEALIAAEGTATAEGSAEGTEAAADASSQTAVIGENMERVNAAVSRIGAEVYNPPDLEGEAEQLEANRQWIQDQMAAGARIIDIGPDQMREDFPGATSLFYQIELNEINTAEYANYLPLQLP